MAGSSPRPIRLVERRPQVCRLGRADVEFLLAEHRGRFEVLPTGRPGRYRLSSLGHVGVVTAPTRTIVIRPKVPLRQFGFLLDPDAPPAAGPVLPEGDGPFAWVAARFAELFRQRAEAGPHRDYAEREGRLATPRGRIDVAAQVREPPGRPDPFHCRRDEFTADVPCNRLARAAAEAALRSPLLDPQARRVIEAGLPAFEDVGAAAVTAADFDRVALDRRTEDYRLLLELGRWLVAGLGAGLPRAGASEPGPAFLIDMGRVFERYVTRGVVAGCAGAEGLRVAAQETSTIAEPSEGEGPLTVRPDLCVEARGRPALVVDAKWKRLRGLPEPDDLHQVIAYGAALGAAHVMLVFPGRRDRSVTYPLSRGAMTVEVRTLRVTAGPEACLRSLARFGRSCRRAAAQRAT